MTVIHYLVRVHSCRIQLRTIPFENLMREERYVEIKKMRKVRDFGRPEPGKLSEAFVIEEREEVESLYYLKLPKSCRCRKFITMYAADQFVESGKATRTFKLLARGLQKDENQIWMPVVRERVPRVDLISRSDMERAYIGSNQKSRHHQYNPRTKKFEVIRTVPEGLTLGQWLLKAEEEVQFERRIRKQYKQYIDQCHDVTMAARSELIVPFRVDPFEGRTLFSFAKEQRTSC
jgi:hypothetical protein